MSIRFIPALGASRDAVAKEAVKMATENDEPVEVAWGGASVTVQPGQQATSVDGTLTGVEQKAAQERNGR